MHQNAAITPFAPRRPDHWPGGDPGNVKKGLDQLGNVGIIKVQAADPGSHLIGLAWLDTDAVQGQRRGVATFTTDQTLSDSYDVVLVDATSGNRTMFLPACISSDGFQFDITKIDSTIRTVKVDADGTDTINGCGSVLLTIQDESITIVCGAATGWRII